MRLWFCSVRLCLREELTGSNQRRNCRYDEDVRWLCGRSILSSFLLRDFIIDLHHVWCEVHATVLIVKLEQRQQLMHRCADFLLGQVVVLKQEPSEPAKCLRLEQVKPRQWSKFRKVIHNGMQMNRHCEVMSQLRTSLPMEERIDEGYEHGQFGLGTMLHREDVNVGAGCVDLLWLRANDRSMTWCLGLSRCLYYYIWGLDLLFSTVVLLLQVLDLIPIGLLDIANNVS